MKRTSQEKKARRKTGRVEELGMFNIWLFELLGIDKWILLSTLISY